MLWCTKCASSHSCFEAELKQTGRVSHHSDRDDEAVALPTQLPPYSLWNLGSSMPGRLTVPCGQTHFVLRNQNGWDLREQLENFMGVQNEVHYHILTAGTVAVGCKEESCSDAAPAGACITECGHTRDWILYGLSLSARQFGTILSSKMYLIYVK